MFKILKISLTLVLSIFTCLVLSNNVLAHSSYYRHHDCQVVIYSDAGFQGAAQTLREGRYNIDRLTIGNDALSSLKVPAGWRVTLYEHAGFTGHSMTLRSDCSFVGDFNDLTSSIVVERVNSLPPIDLHYNRQVSIYSDAGFQGAAQTLREGRYNIDQLTIGNDTLSSLRVPAGWRVTLYEHGDFRGRTKIFTADSRWVGNDFNDVTSAILVEYIGRNY